MLLRLEGTEDKFRNRESRPEDLQTIAELKEMVAERESLVKKLVVREMLGPNIPFLICESCYKTKDPTGSQLSYILSCLAELKISQDWKDCSILGRTNLLKTWQYGGPA